MINHLPKKGDVLNTINMYANLTIIFVMTNNILKLEKN
jgi:hypothetical protein